MSSKPHLSAIVLAAGKGTRMRSSRPKVAHRLAGRALIHYPLQALRELGADPVVVVVGYEAEVVRESCDGFPVRFAAQPQQWGTGHAALCALPQLEGVRGEVLLLYGDLPRLSAETLALLVQRHRARKAAVSLLTARLRDPSGFGRIVRNGRGSVVRIVEQRDASEPELCIDEVNVGIYCSDASFLRDVLPRLRPDNAQRELYLTDIVALAIERGRAVAAVEAPAPEVAQVNWRGELAEMEKSFRSETNRRLMESGVTLEDPDTAYIDASVEIGPDTVVGPNVQLKGTTRIGARCRLDGSAYICDTQIGDDTYLKFGVVISEADIGRGCEVGPFAQLRSGTRLDDGAVIGNFVETKQTRVGPGSKARHLTYLGDAEIGAASNIGAGTITCNYDGFHKYRTIIGSRVMIGSDSQLIAPVSVGDDAYVATGTTVKKDVPPGALVFNSKTQMAREGWTAARRAREAKEVKGAKNAEPIVKKAEPSAKKAKARVKKANPSKGRRSR